LEEEEAPFFFLLFQENGNNPVQNNDLVSKSFRIGDIQTAYQGWYERTLLSRRLSI